MSHFFLSLTKNELVAQNTDECQEQILHIQYEQHMYAKCFADVADLATTQSAGGQYTGIKTLILTAYLGK